MKEWNHLPRGSHQRLRDQHRRWWWAKSVAFEPWYGLCRRLNLRQLLPPRGQRRQRRVQLPRNPRLRCFWTSDRNLGVNRQGRRNPLDPRWIWNVSGPVIFLNYPPPSRFKHWTSLRALANLGPEMATCSRRRPRRNNPLLLRSNLRNTRRRNSPWSVWSVRTKQRDFTTASSRAKGKRRLCDSILSVLCLGLCYPEKKFTYLHKLSLLVSRVNQAVIEHFYLILN